MNHDPVENMVDGDEDQILQAIRELVRDPEPLSPDLVQRIEETIGREVRRLEVITPGEALGVVCTVFLLLLWAAPWPTGGLLVWAGVVAVVAYVLGLVWLLRATVEP